MKKHLSKICLASLWIVLLFLFLFTSCGKEEPAPDPAASSAPAAQTGCGFSSVPDVRRIGCTYADADCSVKYCEYDRAGFLCCTFSDTGDQETDAEAHNDKNSCANFYASPHADADAAEDARARIVRAGYHK